jgi:hypothetical protein
MTTIYKKLGMRRTLGRKSKTTISGSFSSQKNDFPIYYESYLELEALYNLEFDPNVIRIDTQPISIKYTLGNKSRYYTPDLAKFTVESGWVFGEVKPPSVMEKKANQEKFYAIKNAFKRHGYNFEITPGKHVTSKTYKHNLEVIIMARTFNYFEDNIVTVLSALPEIVTLGDALNIITKLNFPHEMLTYFLFKRYYTFNMEKRLTTDSVLSSNIQ